LKQVIGRLVRDDPCVPTINSIPTITHVAFLSMISLISFGVHKKSKRDSRFVEIERQIFIWHIYMILKSKSGENTEHGFQPQTRE
jgi:hypothetical protein